MEALDNLSNNLKPIVDYELNRGNIIERIDRPAGTKCPLAVIFKKPLDFNGFEKNNGKLSGVERWENRDSHYDLEAGYVCEKKRHVIAAPIR